MQEVEQRAVDRITQRIFEQPHGQQRHHRTAAGHRAPERVEQHVAKQVNDELRYEHVPQTHLTPVEEQAVKQADQQGAERVAGEISSRGEEEAARMSASAPCTPATTGPNSVAVAAMVRKPNVMRMSAVT